LQDGQKPEPETAFQANHKSYALFLYNAQHWLQSRTGATIYRGSLFDFSVSLEI